HFESASQKVYKYSDLRNIFSQYRQAWKLDREVRVDDFIGFLKSAVDLDEVNLKFPSRAERRYIVGKTSHYELALTLRKQSYFTHYTALFLHELTDQVPKIIYLNFEQPSKYRQDAELSQENIDKAFQRPVRISKSRANYKDVTICILNGKYTGGKGVIEMKGPMGEQIRVTDMERTLIDIAVRPAYAGGIYEVLKAYEKAKDRVSINRLTAMLKSLAYIYPYHQAIGLYLEKAGYKESSINLLRKFEMKYDFYLTYEMKEKSYSRKWRLYFPQGF
ncbi:MAG: hypothetical protein ABIH04_00930, partial [Planctomycetota bacterium]